MKGLLNQFYKCHYKIVIIEMSIWFLAKDRNGKGTKGNLLIPFFKFLNSFKIIDNIICIAS